MTPTAGRALQAGPGGRRDSLPPSGTALAYSARQLAQALGYKHQHSVWQIAREDDSFPRPVQLVPDGEWRWLAFEVDDWLQLKASTARRWSEAA